MINGAAMSHPIYFLEIEQQARNIEQLCCASLIHLRKFKSLQRIYSDSEMITEYDIELSNYHQWLNYTVSDSLIQICTKIRIYQDSYKHEWDSSYSPEEEAYGAYPNIAEVLDGNVKLTLRECCNKVIHALHFELVMVDSPDNIKYWDGLIILSGTFGKKSWKIKINLYQFSLSIRLYLELFT